MDTQTEIVNLEELRASLASGNSDLSDEQLCDIVARHVISQGCTGAADGFFAALSSVCYFRPHLVKRLLRYPLHPLGCLGYTEADQVLGYVKWSMSRGFPFLRPSFLQRYAGPEGTAWLRRDLPTIREMIQEELDPVVEKLEAEVAALEIDEDEA